MSSQQLTRAMTTLVGDNYFAPHAANYEGKPGLPMSRLYYHQFGAVLTADPDGICASQSAVGAHTLNMDGALVSGGVATFDVPRCIVVDSGGADTAVITITGTDYYGQAQTEAITLNGTTAVNGQKAFKTVTSVTSSATISNGAFVGTTDILGLPYRIDYAEQIIASNMDGAVDAVTVAVADTTSPATTTTNDVRGTVDFSTASNGTRRFAVLMALPTTAGKEAAFGVTPV